MASTHPPTLAPCHPCAMRLPCAICGVAYPFSERWGAESWCETCTALNFPEERRLHDGDDSPSPSARVSIAADISQPVTARQRTALARMVARWEEEGTV